MMTNSRMKTTLLALALFALSGAASAELLCINYTRHASAVWYVGRSTASLDNFPVAGGDDIECQADGAELVYIQQNITGIRGRKGEAVMLWSGEDAMFIVDNL
jgi:hypothetical protein